MPRRPSLRGGGGRGGLGCWGGAVVLGKEQENHRRLRSMAEGHAWQPRRGDEAAPTESASSMRITSMSTSAEDEDKRQAALSAPRRWEIVDSLDVDQKASTRVLRTA